MLKWPFLVNTSPQKCNICVLYHFPHYVCELRLLLEFPWLLSEEVGYNSWQHSSLPISLKSRSYFKTFFWDHYKNKKQMARLSSLITNCSVNVKEKTLKIVTGSNNFNDKLLGCLLTVLSNIFLIKDREFKKLHWCCWRGERVEEIAIPWRLMYLVKQSVFKPKWKTAKNSSELHDETLEMPFITQFAIAVCRCLILWVRLGTLFFCLFLKLCCTALVISSFLISITISNTGNTVYFEQMDTLHPCFKTVTDERASTLWLWSK